MFARLVVALAAVAPLASSADEAGKAWLAEKATEAGATAAAAAAALARSAAILSSFSSSRRSTLRFFWVASSFGREAAPSATAAAFCRSTCVRGRAGVELCLCVQGWRGAGRLGAD